MCVSLLSDRTDGWFTSFARFAVGLAIGLVELKIRRQPFKIVKWKPWLGRGVFGAVAMILYYLSIAYGSAGRASVFNNSFPLFVAIIAILVLRERVFASTVIGLVVAFSGVAVVLWDGAGIYPLADSAGMLSGFLAGISYHFNKKASKTEDPIVIYLGVCIVGMLATAFSAGQIANLDPAAVVLLLLAGAGAYAAQICITIGLRDIPTTEGSVHTFVKIPITVIAGALILGQPVTVRFAAGTALLILGLWISQRSKDAGK